MDRSRGHAEAHLLRHGEPGDGHHVVVVDDRGRAGRAELSRRRVARRALLAGVVGPAPSPRRSGRAGRRPRRRRRCGSRCAAASGSPPTRAIRRWPRATRYSTVSASAAASSDQTLGQGRRCGRARRSPPRAVAAPPGRGPGGRRRAGRRRARRRPAARPTSAGRRRSRPPWSATTWRVSAYDRAESSASTPLISSMKNGSMPSIRAGRHRARPTALGGGAGERAGGAAGAEADLRRRWPGCAAGWPPRRRAAR